MVPAPARPTGPRSPAPEGYAPIEDYGIIGDLHTVALVGKHGSIDFMCFPEFDSPTVFAALLDHEKGGRFSIAPAFACARQRQLYLPDSNILLTRFLADEGVGEVSDYMVVEDSPESHWHDLVRRAKAVRGEVRFRLLCQPRFDYGRRAHTVEAREGEVLFQPRGADLPGLRLRLGVPHRVEDGAVVAEFTLRAGESATFVLEEARTDRPSPFADPAHAARSFKQTLNFWREWVARSSYRGRWREMVNRSALTLKLLTSRRHGSLVAAPTFGLPEWIGGPRNWDYRFTWIRDASFTLYALIRLGYTAEAAAFMGWIEARCEELGPDGSLQVLYGLDGRHGLEEVELAHLEGYRGSAPVRIGNGAAAQLQLDIYGELMDSVYLFDKYGDPISHALWANLVRLIEWVTRHGQQPDEGIWEVRGGRREFLYSRLMCWVALDRGIRLATKRSLPAPLERWTRVRDAFHAEIHASFWDERRGCFVQHKGSTTLDAATLLMPLVKFISPKDPRWLSTLRAIEEDLVQDSLVHRYRIGEVSPDGLAGREGTFTMCSFWFVECVARSGDLQKARFLFEKMLGYASPLGLYSEELGPSGEHLGNFPQAFTHLGLISAAYALDRGLDPKGA